MAALKGKRIVITGSGRGIGAGVAKLCAAEGASVLVTDIDGDVAESTAKEIRAAGGKAASHVADISQWYGAKGLIERCVAEFGGIDGLVNNAGLFRMARLEEMDEKHLRDLFEANVMGTAFCARHAVEHMLKQGSGAIVNVTSGAHMGLPMMGAYGATKGAAASFTYTWANELGPKGIRVNALSPMAASRMAGETDKYFDAKGLPRISAAMPAPEVNAPVVAFLLSDAAKDVNGQIGRIEGRQLSLVAHPGVAVPILEENEWTLAKVTEAFRTDLGQRQFPVGVVGLDVKVAPIAASDLWKANKDASKG